MLLLLLLGETRPSCDPVFAITISEVTVFRCRASLQDVSAVHLHRQTDRHFMSAHSCKTPSSLKDKDRQNSQEFYFIYFFKTEITAKLTRFFFKQIEEL